MKDPQNSVDEYLAQFDPSTKRLLTKIRQTILETVPEAAESISYQMPAYKLNGKPLAYFAAFTKHIGFYPNPGPLSGLAKEIEQYRHSKGAVQFPFDQPIPTELIIKMVKARAAEIEK